MSKKKDIETVSAVAFRCDYTMFYLINREPCHRNHCENQVVRYVVNSILLGSRNEMFMSGYSCIEMCALLHAIIAIRLL